MLPVRATVRSHRIGAPPGSEASRIAAPHRELLDQALDEWSLQVLEELCERPRRSRELRRAIPAVTGESLTATLREPVEAARARFEE